MFRKLNTKLITIFTVLIILILGTVSSTTHYFASKQIEEDVKFQSTTSVEGMKDKIEQYLAINTKNLDRYSTNMFVQSFLSQELLVESDALKKTVKWDDINKDFESFIKAYSDVSVIYIASEKTKKMYTTPIIDLPSDYDPTTRPWYKEAMANKSKVILTDPYIDAATNEYVITIAKAIVDEQTNQTLGVIASDLYLTELSNVVGKTEVGHGGYAFLTDKNGIALVHPTETGNDLTKYEFMKKVFKGENKQGFFHYSYKGQDKVMGYDTIESTGWKIGASYEKAKLFEAVNNILFSIFIISLIAIIISFIVTWLISRSITKPIAGIVNEMSKVSQGDLTVKLEAKTKDEIGQLTTHFNNMVTNIKELVSEVGISVNEVKASAENLSAVTEETIASSHEIGRAISEIAAGANQTANDAESTNYKTAELANQLEKVNEHTEQMTILSKQANETNQNGIEQVNTLRLKTNESNEVFSQVSNVMQGLLDKVKEIENIIGTINSVSEQTNLLALNASIEAARAGEHGKGFAVVAEEVRKLAEQSSNATNQVKQTIMGINEETAKATEAMEQANMITAEQGKVVSDTEAVFKTIASTMDEIVTFISKIGDEVQNMNIHKEDVITSIESISAVAEQSAAATEEVTASTEEQIRAISSLADSAEKLNESSEQLKKMINQFKIYKVN